MPTLTPWRQVVAPHPDVQSGRYLLAEFVANLADVRSGTASDEYKDPAEFFRRTYLTAGMRRLLMAAIARLHGRGEAPVVELKTAFGGGKTHTLLALYHLLRAPDAAATVPAVAELMAAVGGRPPGAQVAVIVGTDFSATDPSAILRPLGVEVHTLWGEIAAQLGNLRGYQVVEDADQAGVAPGADQLRRLLTQVGPAVILMDELVAFLRNLEAPVKKLRAGSLSANLTFLQALTEAVRSTPTAMLIASIPESDDELGGAAGRTVLAKVEKVFGRMEEVWQPVEVQESFEVVRRRLFGPVADPVARDATVAAFGELYRQSPGDFPPECREAAYERRMVTSYPIHPEVFDRLYEDWASLERFQRTRGVLRLMAKAIHEIWQSGDAGALILPGTIPFEAAAVRNELTRYLGDQWNSVIDTDVQEASAELDRQVPRLGAVSAARRLARAILLGSAPERSVKGSEDVRLKLGVVQPHEPGGIAVYVDALQRMRDTLTFLYSTTGGGRYWFAVQANLNRTVADRINRLPAAEVTAEIERRLKAWPARGSDFAGVILAPHDSADVPDEDRARLVVLPPARGYKRGDSGSEAVAEAAAILENHGSSPRRYRNMLLFLAAGADDYANIESEARRYLAWKSVWEERQQLNLDDTQRQQADKTMHEAGGTLDKRLQDAYVWLLNPVQEGIEPLQWEANYLTGASDDPIRRASTAAVNAGLLITRWSPVALQQEFQRYLWKGGEPHIAVKTLWQQLATYNYLSRLQSADVLRDTIRAGASSQDYFGYATSVDPATGKYQGLSFGRQPTTVFIDEHSVLVSPSAAREAQTAATPAGGSVGLDAAAGARRVPVGNGTATGEATGAYTSSGRGAAGPAAPAPPTHFYGRVEVDPLRLSTLASQISAEVLQYLMGAGVAVQVTIEIQAEIPAGAAEATVRTVTENAHTLRFKAAEFE